MQSMWKVPVVGRAVEPEPLLPVLISNPSAMIKVGHKPTVFAMSGLFKSNLTCIHSPARLESTFTHELCAHAQELLLLT